MKLLRKRWYPKRSTKNVVLVKIFELPDGTTRRVLSNGRTLAKKRKLYKSKRDAQRFLDNM